jgi:exodeoxyribonuclease VIII
MQNEEYQSMTDRVSASMLKVFLSDKAKYNAYWVEKTQAPPDLSTRTAVMVGDCVHQILLEKKVVTDVVVNYPESCFKSNGAINPKPASEFREIMAADGKYVVKDDEFRRIVEICNSVIDHPLGQLVSRNDIVFEEPVFWTDDSTGIDCRAKPDFMYVDDKHVLCYDLKVSESSNPDTWVRISKRLNYWLQAAHYISGLAHVHNKPVRFVFWVIESAWPYRIAQYEFDAISLERCTSTYSNLMSDLKRRTESGDWKESWELGSNSLLIESWDLKEQEEELEGFDD